MTAYQTQPYIAGQTQGLKEIFRSAPSQLMRIGILGDSRTDPFVWLRIHPGTTGKLNTADHFRNQLRLVLDLADGVCVWDWADTNTGTDVLRQASEIMQEFVSWPHQNS